MDPISLTAGILAIIEAAHASVRGLQKLHAYGHAPQELNRLRAELESLQGLLHNIKTLTERHVTMSYCEVLHEPLERAFLMVKNVETMLSQPAFGLTRLSDANKARATWLRYKSRMEILGEEIKSVKLDLGVRLGLITV